MSEVDIIGNQARSKEGRGLSVRGGDSDKWITIQKNTFQNWINLQLHGSGLTVENLQEDLCDGVKLCTLVSALQQKPSIGRVIKKPNNPHQFLENVTLALNAIAADNIRLVNIGSEDIVNGSLKLILGLIWHLILRYQIGKTKFPPKKLMLAWLKAVVPDCQITNFTSDWNDGVNLHAVIDYCQPGLCPDWRQLSRQNRLDNCRNAMMIAQDKFDIPLVVRPEDLASPHLDDLSGMTYLSYFMNVDSPGYLATLRNVNAINTQGGRIDDFSSSWNDGTHLCNLVKSLGQNPGSISPNHVDNIQTGIDCGRRLGVEPILSAKEMADPEVEHLGIMAYAAYFTHLKPVKSLADKAIIDGNFSNVYVGQEKTFRLNIDDDVSAGDFRAEVIGPDSIPPVRLNWSGRTATGSFTPSEMGQHRLNVYCVNEPLASCPIPFKVSSDRSKVTFHPVDRCPVGVITELKVDTSSAGQGDIRMEVETPNGHTMNLPVVYRQSMYTANFTPAEVGDHRIFVHYDNEQIVGSPFVAKAFDPSKVNVYGLEGGSVGRALSFTADSQSAGEGEVSVVVAHNGVTIPSQVITRQNGKHNIDFTPQGAGVYRVQMYYNNVEIRGSPYTLEIVDSSMVSVSGDGLSLVPVNKTASFNVHTRGAGGGNVSVDITSPNGDTVPCDLSSDSGGVLVAEYFPTVVGDHTLRVLCNGTEIADSPYIVKTYDTSAITVTDLPDGYVSQPIIFSIDVSQAGEGQLQIMVNNGNLPNDVEMVQSGVYRISFVPVEPGVQTVDISFNDEALPMSPLTCNAVDLRASIMEIPTLQPVETQSTFLIRSLASDASVAVELMAPSGELVPANLVRQSDGDYKVEWTPTTAGKHSVDVLFAGQQIQGSPFFINVFDINKIRVDNFYNGGLEETAGFNVDCSQAGRAEQSIWVVSPSGRNVPVDIQETRPAEYAVSYVPHEVGRHKIHLTYGALEHPGSPFTQEIGEGALATAHGDGLYRGEEDKPATFFVESGGITGEPTIQVDGPNSIAKCSIDPQPGGRFAVTYVPVETGLFDITVKWNGRDIHGSPFHPRIVDARKVRVIGGWQHYMDSQERIHLVVGEEKHIPFETAEAGPGKLTAEVRGPSGSIVPCTVDDSYNGKSSVVFTPREEGHHSIHLNWSGHPLSGSAFSAYATGGFHDITKIILSGRGLKEATVREEAEFFIDGSQAGRGEPQVQLTGVRAEVNVIISPLGGGKYRCTYIPVIPGAYLLHITWNGRQVKGAPFKVNVIGAFYPNKVAVTGEGLKGGLLGRDLDIRIDTRKAGPGKD
ncbi:filamin-C-like isoform X2 [Haliotis rubra]|uniref:filamin-C-like isoform X2 n=1 Tax=Haliotis rubra TaxID=36100 RepID=UPI001EE508BD|nr:filamin-C-like isoform X2 [Haliotis rubra]